MNASTALLQLGGVARRADLVASVGRAEFDRAVAAKEIKRQSRGLYVSRLPDQARLMARQTGGVLSHLAAARRWNIGLTMPLEKWDVTLPRGTRRRSTPDGARLHYADLSPEDVADGCTTRLRTVVDCLRSAPPHLALAVLESAAERVDMAEIEGRVGTMRGPGSARARRILSWYDARACPPLESALRGTLLVSDITCFQPQFEVWDGNRKIATTDLGDAKSRVLLEADSFQNHGGRDQLVKDAFRYDELVARGYHVLRFTYPPIAAGSPWILNIVRRTLASHDRS